MLKVTDEQFKSEVLESDIPVLVDFYAAWCAPCKVVTPMVEKMESDYEGEVKFVKVDVDNSNKVAADYGIRGIPTLLMFNKGEVVGSNVGVIAEGKLISFIMKNR